MASYFDSGSLGRRERYERLRSSLWSERQSGFDSHWKELADFFLPRRTRWFAGDRNRGDKRNQNIIDSTGRFAARTLQSGLHAGLTSPARPWFKLSTPDPDLAKMQAVKEWLNDVTVRMQVIFTDTNLYNVLPICYGDMGVFGTHAMSVIPDTKDLFRCYAYPIGSYALGLDNRGIASTFVRDYVMTVRQIVGEFGATPGRREIDWTTISRTVQDLWDRGDYETTVEVCWLVTPNDNADPSKLAAEFKPWISCHWEKGDSSKPGAFLRVSGFDSFPILAPRWDTTGEDTYGTDCPGMTALGDNKQLQIMQRELGKAIKKQVDPPLVGVPQLRTQKTSLLPGDITYVDSPDKALRAIHQITLHLGDLQQNINGVQYRIQRAFYEDLFLMLAASDQQRGSQPVTAREVQERHEEKLLALGPVLERTNDELLDPLVDRAFSFMADNHLLPPLPEALKGIKLKVEYISIMAEAMKLVGAVGLDRFVGSVAPLVEFFPEIRNKIVINQVVDSYAEIYGIDPRIIRDNDEADQLSAAQAKQQQEAAQAEQAQQVAKATKDAGTTPMGTDSALDRIVSAAAGGAIH